MTEEFVLTIGKNSNFDYGSIEVKGTKKYYITGYASTGDIDLVNDMITEEGLQDMLEQIKGTTIKLDLEHEAWTKEEGPNILPVGKIVEAKYDSVKKGLWIKAILNDDSNKFQKIWNNLKNKFVDAFSIAFRPIESVTQIIDGAQVRLLKKLKILNVALTGNPANPNAKITDVFVKSLNHLDEVYNMEETKNPVEEQPQEVVQEETLVEAKSYEIDLKNLQEEFAKSKEDYEASLKSLREELKFEKESKEQFSEQLAELKALLEKPQMKAILEDRPDEPVVEQEVKETNPLDLIR